MTKAPDAPAVILVTRVASPEEAESQPLFALADLAGAPAPALATTVRFASTHEAFIALFDAVADPPLTVGHGDDEDVFLDECVELFLASPTEPRAYREIVVNPQRACYTATIVNPDESRDTWRLSRGRASAAISIDVRGDPAARPAAEWARWRCRLAVPWASLPSGRAPAEGEERRGNAYRIARGRTTRYLALSPTFRSSPPDFHVPSRFARFVF
ncbi:MAG: carbohydrate-binding family 9-like protein [Thermoanaerobaculia bacterium]